MTLAAPTRPTHAQAQAPLLQGDLLRCPSCNTVHPLWRYKPLQFDPRHASVAVPIFKCPKCRFLFAPLGTLAAESES